MDDSYLTEFTARVTSVEGSKIFLDQTAFYPSGGGQPNDTGTLEYDGERFAVINVTKENGDIAHHVDKEGLKIGDVVSCEIDWTRRHRLMRMHTAAHIIDAVLYRDIGALCTGNQLDVEKSRIDFSAEKFDPAQMKKFVDIANSIAKQCIELKIYYLSREDAMRIPGIVKLASAMPPDIQTLRIVEIPGVDIQADGGTQVRNTIEIGTIEFLKVENRGKNNRRIYYTVK
jgi:Ser-tRNA(Ala) deacylase AlaX